MTELTPQSTDGVGAMEVAEHQRCLRDLLELQRAQLTALRADGQQRLDELAEAFELMAASATEPPSGHEPDASKTGSDVIVRTLQFADNQAQRLEHLIQRADQIGSLAVSPTAQDEASWSALRLGIRASYTMARECEVFDGLFGAPEDALPYAQESGPSDDSIELF